MKRQWSDQIERLDLSGVILRLAVLAINRVGR
jgi:hypothetical protein